ncbi:MAG: glycoside hydrolase family 2 TIM barrel-domain containing protein [Armatimonadota bacterium]
MRFMFTILCAVLFIDIAYSQGESAMSNQIDAIPQGYHMQAYDDCGFFGWQPHVQVNEDTYNFTFSTTDNDADYKARTAVFSYKGLKMAYHDLDPNQSYALALTYATDQVFKRVQSLWADGVELHGPIALPKGTAIKVFVNVPKSVTEDGNMTLEIKIHGEVNATVSAVELWSSGPPSADALRVTSVSAVFSDLKGRVVDMTSDPIDGAVVKLVRRGTTGELASTQTGNGGWFEFPKETYESQQSKDDLQIVASFDGSETVHAVKADELKFDPVRYRPIPVKTQNLARNTKSLDGTWKIHPDFIENAWVSPLTTSGWRDVNIPGQWKQQGFDIPQDRVVAVAKEFTVPREWSGQRIFLRFESIHSGVTYRVNGHKLGCSENLFTPVEWEITSFVKSGADNRIDLEMKVQTVSEQLSWSSSYAFHSLGGIDRSVSIYALPKINVKDMHVSTDLDKEYRDADLNVALTLDNQGANDVSGLTIDLSLKDADGDLVDHPKPKVIIEGLASVISTHIPDPLKWSAEKPNLYKMTIDVKKAGELLERIERNVGFRKIEVRGSQVLINGQVVKFAGVNHHEIDPLTGRADTARHAEEDVRMLKAANLNYIRTSHYPPTKELVDAADKIGMYLEVEAPFCGVAPTGEIANLKEILTPTSAMLDYFHSHPSVIVWSAANESHPSPAFEIARKMIVDLDPTRLTTFNHPMSKPETTLAFDIGNWHYSPMPYDDVLKSDDPRPFFLGEYFFPVCHEQIDVRINPGLRELWGHGHADPESEWGKFCSTSYGGPYLIPGVPSGTWSYIDKSEKTLGGAIWAANDDSFYFPDGSHCGFSWHHGYWGLIDAWRRPKPEFWLAKMIFTPVWFPVRQLDYLPGQKSVMLPVENRYSFTDLSELKIFLEIGGHKERTKTQLAPRSSGVIEIPIPDGTPAGTKINLEVTDSNGELINRPEITLGKKAQSIIPQPTAGSPKWNDDGKTVIIEGKDYTLVLDKSKGCFDASSPKHKAPITEFPSLHVTRYDPGDLQGDHGRPYAIYPDAETRVVDSVTVNENSHGLVVTINEHYDNFKGSISWLIDKEGMGKVSYDYTYTGDELDTREQGIRFKLPRAYDEIKWSRWSEWGDVFPKESISRTEGSAKALRPGTTEPDLEHIRSDRPWSQDQTELGTADFRSIKFNIYNVSLVASNGTGIRVHANADAHVRPCLAENGVMMHILNTCRMGETTIKKGDKLTGEFVVELLKN